MKHLPCIKQHVLG